MKRLINIILVFVFGFTLITPYHLMAMSSEQRRAIDSGALYFNTEEKCGPGISSPTSGGITSGTVYILGDSITRGAESYYRNSFQQKGITPFINASDGRSWRGQGNQSTSEGNAKNGKDAIEHDREQVASAKGIIIAIGSNNGIDSNPIDEVIDTIRSINKNSPIWWIDTVGTSSYRSAALSYLGDFNDQLYSKSSSKGYSVIPWSKTVNQDNNPSSMPTTDPKGLLGDGLHPNEGGYNELTNLVVSTVSNPSSSETVSGAPNTTYTGRQIWSDADISTINNHKSVYEQAAQDVGGGMTWQLVAVLHKIESSLSTSNPSNGQGLFQDYGRVNAPTPGQNYPPGEVTNEEFLRQAKWGARFFKEGKSDGLNHPSNNKDLTTAEGVKFALMAFNGLSGGQWKSQAIALGYDGETEMYEGSSYVMNYADEKRNPEVNRDWGGYHGDGRFGKPAPKNIGTWLMYNALLGLTGGASFDGGSGCSEKPISQFSGDIAQKIVQLAEREYATMGDRDIESNNDNFKYTDGVQQAWCANFVSWILKEAGSPFTGGLSGGWRVPAVTGVQAWFEENGDWNPVGSGYTPKPGDIAVYNTGSGAYPQHVNIVVSVENGIVTTIGGNESSTMIKKRTNIGSESLTGYGTKR